ncbi:MAG: PHP domain-containing protein [bacterium]
MNAHQPIVSKPKGARAPWADLHTHTTASDGSMEPATLVQEAFQIGLGALAITDHDTLDGLQEALDKGKSLGVWVIPGVEISVNGGEGRSFHLLGYGVEPHNSPMENFLKAMRQSRAERNWRVMERLAQLGYPLKERDLEKPVAEAGRPHIAAALVKRGYVATTEEAFVKLLGKRGKAYVSRKRPFCREAIRAVLEAGGVPVLAHPHTAGCQDFYQLERLIGALADCGLMGIETLYPDAPPALIPLCKKMAGWKNLLLTGGTDFHGLVKPHINLGFGRGSLRVPLEWAQQLEKAIHRVRRGFFLDKPGARG